MWIFYLAVLGTIEIIIQHRNPIFPHHLFISISVLDLFKVKCKVCYLPWSTTTKSSFGKKTKIHIFLYLYNIYIYMYMWYSILYIFEQSDIFCTCSSYSIQIYSVMPTFCCPANQGNDAAVVVKLNPQCTHRYLKSRCQGGLPSLKLT